MQPTDRDKIKQCKNTDNVNHVCLQDATPLTIKGIKRHLMNSQDAVLEAVFPQFQNAFQTPANSETNIQDVNPNNNSTTTIPAAQAGQICNDRFHEMLRPAYLRMQSTHIVRPSHPSHHIRRANPRTLEYADVTQSQSISRCARVC